MEKEDFRSLGRDPQEALRVRAVQLVRTLGKTQAEAVESVGVHHQTVNQWLKRHAKSGEAAPLDGRRALLARATVRSARRKQSVCKVERGFDI
jgi:transposase